MSFPVPTLPMLQALREEARRVGKNIASQEIPQPTKLADQKLQIARIRRDCTKWAAQQSKAFETPRKYPGMAICLFGFAIIYEFSVFDDGLKWMIVIGIITSFSGISIVYTNTLGTKSPSYIAARNRQAVKELAAIAVESAIRNLRKSPSSQLGNPSSTAFRQGATSQSPRQATAQADQVATPRRPVQKVQAASWEHDAVLQYLNIFSESVTVPNLRYSQMAKLGAGSPKYLVYVNLQNRKMDLDRYIRFTTMTRHLKSASVTLSYNGFTASTIKYADESNDLVFELISENPRPVGVTNSAKLFLTNISISE